MSDSYQLSDTPLIKLGQPLVNADQIRKERLDCFNVQLDSWPMQLSLWQSSEPDQSGVHALPRAPGGRPAPLLSARTLSVEELASEAETYVQKAHTDRTRLAYRRDWDSFERWCVAAQLTALPASPHTLELCLTHLAKLGRKASTIRRARIAIGLRHGHSGLERPDKHARIRTLERGIGCVHGAREQGARPLLDHELARVVGALGSGLREQRDRAVILVGFAGGFRSSELSGFDMTDVTFTANGAELLVRKSKVDRLGLGQATELPFGSSPKTCPVLALREWIGRVGRPSGPLFRVILGSSIEHQRIHPRAVTRALQRAVARATIDGDFSSHSLRCGIVTSAHLRGASDREIQKHVRMIDERSVGRYTRLQHVTGRVNVASGLF